MSVWIQVSAPNGGRVAECTNSTRTFPEFDERPVAESLAPFRFAGRVRGGAIRTEGPQPSPDTSTRERRFTSASIHKAGSLPTSARLAGHLELARRPLARM
jgi:hypothetical protein